MFISFLFSGQIFSVKYERRKAVFEACNRLYAKQTILVQAYSFTSAPIAKAVVDAQVLSQILQESKSSCKN